MRLVIDTNVLISALLFARSMPRQAADRAMDEGILLFSESTMDELKSVLLRPKFDRYLGREPRFIFVAQMESVAEMVPTIQVVRECRDPTDDKLLEVAWNGRADLIVTGDEDLLRMHPWRGIAILSPADYLIEHR